MHYRGETKSLFSVSAANKGAPVKVNDGGGYDSLVLEDEGHPRRDVDTLRAIVKDLFTRQYKDVSLFVHTLTPL